MAAPTTSLPEVAGGTRNWDYRYSWIRDASMTLQALWVAACPDEAGKFFQFLATAAASQLAGGEELQIMFGIGGERELPERELAHLPGWRGSAPVRVGNGAWNQRQLDVYGELLDAAATLPEYLAELAPDTRKFLADAADTAAAAGGPPITASGKSAGSGATTCTPSSCAGWPWTAPSPSPESCRHPKRSRAGPRRGTRSRRPSAPRAGARRRMPTPRRTAPRTSMPRP